MLGMQPWSSARAVSVLNQGDISSVHLALLSEDKKSLQNILEREKLNFLIKKSKQGENHTCFAKEYIYRR